MDLMEYAKGKDPLYKKEEYLFDVVEKLDKKSLALYREIMDLSDKSLYKTDILKSKVMELMELSASLSNAFVYLNEIEMSSYNFANSRFMFKKMLTSIMTVYAFLANPILGIISFVALSKKAGDDYINELLDINDVIDKFDFDKVRRINRTALNCDRMITDKCIKEEQLEESSTDTLEYYNILKANYYIINYLRGSLDESLLDTLDNDTRNLLMEILQSDLNSESDNIYDLLERTKKSLNDKKELLLK